MKIDCIVCGKTNDVEPYTGVATCECGYKFVTVYTPPHIVELLKHWNDPDSEVAPMTRIDLWKAIHTFARTTRGCEKPISTPCGFYTMKPGTDCMDCHDAAIDIDKVIDALLLDAERTGENASTKEKEEAVVPDVQQDLSK